MTYEKKEYYSHQKSSQENDESKEKQMGTEKHSIPYELQQINSAAYGKSNQRDSISAGAALEKDQCQNHAAQPVCKEPYQKYSRYRNREVRYMFCTQNMPDIRTVYP